VSREKPPVHPLTVPEARGSLANRLSRTADRVRQVATRLGARPYRLVLVWCRWTGDVRGEGEMQTFREMEILPCPKVATLDSVTFSVFHAGTIPAGSIKVTEVSTRYTFDELQGHMAPELHEDVIPQPWTFFYELREDGRGDALPIRQRFTLLTVPTRDAENVQWTLMLERRSEDRDREGKSQYLSGTQG
jgi:hypothetical protein